MPPFSSSVGERKLIVHFVVHSMSYLVMAASLRLLRRCDHAVEIHQPFVA